MIRSLFERLRTRMTRRLIRDPAAVEKYGMTLAEWTVYHQAKLHFKKMHWMGVGVVKNPLDLWIYQEIIWDSRPEVVVELGSAYGGTALFFCHLFDMLGQGRVISVDIDRSIFQVRHPRLELVTGDCADPRVVAQVRSATAGQRALVVHDADHTKDAVLRDLRLYADLVSVGSYLIVEDGNLDEFRFGALHGWTQGEGPLVALRQFIAEDGRFEIDAERERYKMTYNPSGYLKRVR